MLTPAREHKEEILHLSIIVAVIRGMQKLSALNIKKERFHKAQTVSHILKEYRASRLIMFSINCFIVLGNVSPYSESVFPNIFEHVGSCKSF